MERVDLNSLQFGRSHVQRLSVKPFHLYCIDTAEREHRGVNPLVSYSERLSVAQWPRRNFVAAMTSGIEGGCLCGGLRYRLEVAPTGTNDCHCIDCRRSSGAPFVTWGNVPRAKLKMLAGQVRKVPHANRVRSFAACCGTHLFFEDAPDADNLDIAIATLDDPTPFPPAMSIWTEDRLPWVILDQSRPVYRRSRRDG